MSDNKKQRSLFATRLGVIAATVGSSVGLGNIWRFPYEAGNHGGGAFMLCYIGFILLLGIPVICAEFVLGRNSHSDFFGCFDKHGRWKYMSFIGITASLMILSFYSVVAGWTMGYLFNAVTGHLGTVTDNGGSYGDYFAEFTSGTWQPLMWTVLFLTINHLVVRGGVQKGIERVSNILMPLLFVCLVTLCINSLFMPGARKGLEFLFAPDFSCLTPGVVLSAMGQAFFSLSSGLGCMLTYASYFNDKTRLLRNAGITAGLDTLVAILAGVMIFPAVFTYGISPTQGPALVFDALPTIFGAMPGGELWASIFFLMLFVASLTSTISMSEISIAYFVDQRGLSRAAACRWSSAIAIIGGTLCTLSFTGVSDLHFGDITIKFFDLFNDLSSNVLLPLGGLLISVFVGWRLDKRIFANQLTNNGRLHGIPVWLLRMLLRWVCPVAIALIFAASTGIIG